MSAHPLSPATQATLLLCSPLRAGRNKDVQPLSIGEFNELAKQLSRAGAGLEQLLAADAAALLKKISPAVDGAKIETLLGRGFMLSLAVETWQSAGVWVTSRNETDYPARLHRLKQNAPPLIYGCGERQLLSRGGLAIVGSRDVDAAGEEFTKRAAASAARETMQVVSGGARGVDQLAMLAALEAGGTVVGVLADSLLRSATSGQARESIQDGRLALVSAFDPEAGFNVGNAMQRNKQIYALADFGLVVSSGYNEGGTWSGAIEQLEKLQLTPIFVRADDDVPEGNRQLLRRGGLPFPEVAAPGLLRTEMEAAAHQSSAPLETGDLFAASALHETPSDHRGRRHEPPATTRRKKI
jgi:predicted Rossmann fold nucleotide-binding protein DprA/Smf involved in DNA uptake